MIFYGIAMYCIKSYGIVWYCIYHYWLRRAGCISQDTYLLHTFDNQDKFVSSEKSKQCITLSKGILWEITDQSSVIPQSRSYSTLGVVPAEPSHRIKRLAFRMPNGLRSPVRKEVWQSAQCTSGKKRLHKTEICLMMC